MHLRFLILTYLIISFSTLLSQTNYYPEYSYKPDKQYFKSYLEVSKRIAISPLRWNKKQWIKAGSAVVVGTALYIYDSEIRTLFQNNQSAAADATSKYFFEPWGNGIYPTALIGSFYIHGLISNNYKSRQIALGATQAFIMSRISAEIIKHLTHRHRPYNDIPANPRLWEGPFRGFEYRSFPSGHTITAFSLASFFSSVYNEKLWVSIISYSIATGVGLQRIYEDEHWSSDVFIAAALGFAIGKSVYYVLSKNSNLSLGVSDTGGISLVYHIQ